MENADDFLQFQLPINHLEHKRVPCATKKNWSSSTRPLGDFGKNGGNPESRIDVCVIKLSPKLYFQRIQS